MGLSISRLGGGATSYSLDLQPVTPKTSSSFTLYRLALVNFSDRTGTDVLNGRSLCLILVMGRYKFSTDYLYFRYIDLMLESYY